VNVEIRFPSYDAQQRAFLTWRPIEVKLKLTDSPAGGAAQLVTVSARTLAGGAQLSFARTLADEGASNLGLELPADGSEVGIFVGGAFPGASAKFGDVVVEVRQGDANASLLGSHPTMVRVRKDANSLSTFERDRFLAALATLNGSGGGPYRDFRDMHVGGPPDVEAHGGPGFLPWHRMYLLDFERELQGIDAEVTLPYWRFDQAAPNLFHRSFIGLPNASSQVEFAPDNPLLGWVADGPAGVQRGRGVGPQTTPAVAGELQTLANGGAGQNANFADFRAMQFDPHGAAHMSHISGWITNPATAPRDPLFFLLHCNVDRLWAKWQWAVRLHDPDDARSFTPPSDFRPGHRLNDPLWPWCGPLDPPRPTIAPGGPMVPSPMTAAPAASPKVRDTIDYFGNLGGALDQAFAYDDVPFQA
jgi:tyrosinase